MVRPIGIVLCEYNFSFLPLQTLTQFNDKINRLSAGEVVNDDNLFVLLRNHFQKWKEELESSQNSCECY